MITININDYKRFDGETDDELIYRITGEKEIIGTWKDVAEILNSILGTSYDESAFRKKRQSFDRLFEVNKKIYSDYNSQIESLNEKIRELEIEKVRFRDERNAWSRQNYIGARVFDKLNKLEDALCSQGKTIFDNHDSISFESDNDMLVILSDLHIGQCFDSSFGKYNSDIAKERLSQYLNHIKNIQLLHKSANCFVSLQGDMISNSIHKQLAITNRENVINQIKTASELISSFCYELTKIFPEVYMSSVCGNHSRIDRKEDALHDERLDDLIAWNVGLSLKHISNFHTLDNNIDNGIAIINIRGKEYVSCHGDFDPFSKQGVANLILMIGKIPYAILYGHMHTCAVDETNGIKMIRGGSLAGSGDSFTIEKRLSGKPSQMVCICNEKGVAAYYPIEFD